MNNDETREGTRKLTLITPRNKEAMVDVVAIPLNRKFKRVDDFDLSSILRTKKCSQYYAQD